MSALNRRSWIEASLLCLGAAGVGVLTARSSAPPAEDFAASFQKDWQTAREYTLEVAEAMPAELYSYRPKDTMRSFGALLKHIGQGGFIWPSLVQGLKAFPPGYELEGETTKENLTGYLNRSFDHAAGVVAEVSPEVLGEEIDIFQGFLVAPRWKVFDFMLDHVTHHRGYAIVYLRLNDIIPPGYRYGGSKPAPQAQK